MSELNTLVAQLPEANRITLTALMQHLGKVVGMFDANKMDPNSLAAVWAPIILYPSEDQLIFQFRQAQQAITVVAQLMSLCDCSGRPAIKAPPVIPRKPKADHGARPGQYENITVAGQQSLYMSASEARQAPQVKPRAPKPAAATAKAALSSFPWFAESMDRATAESRLQDCPDGTFLVRSSTSHQGYSLTVKYREIRHIVINFSNGKYGFSEPTNFDSVIDLVQCFQSTPLSQYNAELETTLRYPFKTAPKQMAPDDSGYEEQMTEELYIRNVLDLRESLEQQARQNQRTMNEYSSTVKDKQRDVKAQEEIVTMFKEQKKLHESYRESLSDQDRQAVQSNYELLISRLSDAERQLTRLSSELQREKQKEDSARTAAGPAVQSSVVVSEGATFFVGNTSREEADRMLEGQPDGTFLVRLSTRSQTEPCALSLRYNGVTKHIHIHHDGFRYGLAEPLSFNSLDSLCEYYKNEKLSGSIATTLKTPIKDARR